MQNLKSSIARFSGRFNWNVIHLVTLLVDLKGDLQDAARRQAVQEMLDSNFDQLITSLKSGKNNVADQLDIIQSNLNLALDVLNQNVTSAFHHMNMAKDQMSNLVSMYAGETQQMMGEVEELSATLNRLAVRKFVGKYGSFIKIEVSQLDSFMGSGVNSIIDDFYRVVVPQEHQNVVQEPYISSSAEE